MLLLLLLLLTVSWALGPAESEAPYLHTAVCVTPTETGISHPHRHTCNRRGWGSASKSSLHSRICIAR